MDIMARKADVSFSADRYAETVSLRIKNRRVRLIKPQTFMNLSGKAVRYWMQQDQLQPHQLIVVTDDLALPFGRIRLRTKGSDGGHNGLKDIQNTLQTQQYPRLRFGIGQEYALGRQVDYVLSPWSASESKALLERLQKASDALETAVLQGMGQAMSQFNNQEPQ